MDDIDRIVTHKAHWVDKQHELITKLSVASFEENEECWNQLLEDFTTYALIIKRFDEKLRVALAHR